MESCEIRRIAWNLKEIPATDNPGERREGRRDTSHCIRTEDGDDYDAAVDVRRGRNADSGIDDRATCRGMCTRNRGTIVSNGGRAEVRALPLSMVMPVAQLAFLIITPCKHYPRFHRE